MHHGNRLAAVAGDQEHVGTIAAIAEAARFYHLDAGELEIPAKPVHARATLLLAGLRISSTRGKQGSSLPHIMASRYML